MQHNSKLLTMNELTFELTNRCSHQCQYCSSNASPNGTQFLPFARVEALLRDKRFARVHLSGGEPLCHPDFWRILKLAKSHADDVVLHTNAITHIAFNPNVIDGVYVDCYLNVPPETNGVHILKRVEQGREGGRPELHASRNWQEACSCDHRVVRPDGSITRSPCDKWAECADEPPNED